ncbi:MAG: Ig-like domain-containing protein [Candidatus Zixiibacteriota bacterium]
MTVSIVARVATITTPNSDWNGSETITFTATDPGLAADSDSATFTVTGINDAPVLANIGPRSVTEGANLNFTVSATDADGEIPVLTAGTPPSNATFVDNGNGTGTFNFNPDFLQSGIYTVTFYARDAVLAVDSEVVTITVNEAGNQLPVLAPIGPRSVTEGGTLAFTVSATDIEDPSPALTTSTLPSRATFIDNGDGTGSFNFQPNFQQAGVYQVTFFATDDSSGVDFEIVTITVNEAGNQPPVLATIGPRSVIEGGSLNFGVSATDPDGTTPTLNTSTLPLNASFVDNGNGTGNFSFTPDFTQAGTYNITFRATDGILVDTEIVVITVVDAGNRTPVLAEIGPKSVTEGTNLHIDVSATDADGTIPTLTTSTLPLNATFINNGDGTGDFDFTPDFLQSGIRSVTFYASDGVATDSEVVFITIIDAGNQSPVLAPIGPRSVTEGSLLTFGVSASDPEEASPSLTTSSLPANASFVDNLDGTGTFTFNPGFTQAGTYNITFTATDDSLATDFEIVTITVNEAGNQAPVLAAIGPRSVDENVLLTFGVSASDPDATIPVLTTSALPANASFVDNLNGTGTFSFTPSFFQSGLHTVTFRASDGIVVDSEIVTITVNNVNRAPILDPIGPRAVNENATLNFTVTSSDPDLTIPALTATGLPANASFVDNLNGTGSFTFAPSFYQAGTYNVTFTASDGSLIDDEIVTITVNNVNQDPILNPIGPLFVTEGQNLNVLVTATDGDSTALTLTAAPLPLNATFVDNGNGTGTFNFNPNYRQSGIVSLTFTVSDGVATDQELVFVTINEAGNQPPVLAPIGPRLVQEGTALSFTVSATDPEGNPPDLTASPLPTNASFVDNNNGTGSFSFTPDFTQAGVYNITFTATDDSLATDFELVTITVVESGNQAPVLSAIGPRSTTEGVNLNFAVTASDPDATVPVLATSPLPSGATFVDNGNGTGTFSWTPGFTQAGVYPVTFVASDGILADSELVQITVIEAGNQRPVLAAIGARSTTENVNLNFGVSAADADGTTPVLTASPLPTGATFVNNGNGTGTFNWTPGFAQQGVYPVTFVASDGSLADSELVQITVIDAGNQTPILAAIGPRSTTENVTLTFGVSATDADGTFPALTTSPLPSGALFVDNGDGTGTFGWTPTFTQAGIYPVTFVASDGVAADSEVVQITVFDAGNQSPVLAAIGPRSTTENVNLNFSVSATDADATIPALSTSTLPSGATFIDNGNGSGTFNWTPSFTQAGVYPITFVASDGIAADSEIVQITVIDAGNQTPVLAAIGPRSTTENVNLNFSVSATDADATVPILTTSPLPSGALFTDNGNGTGTFNWTPGFTQAGVYPVTFVASDGVLADSELVQITVIEAGNQTPLLAAIGPRSTPENVNLNFAVSATDADATTPLLSTSPLPSGATFVDNGNGTGTFNWTPSFAQQGVYPVTFVASDGIAADSELVQITVIDAGNQAPVLAAIGPRSVAENASLNFSVSATDADATIPSLTASPLPSGALFTDNGNGTGTFDWTPSFTQAGPYSVTFVASDGIAADSEAVVITVTNTNRRPVANAGPDQFDLPAGQPVQLDGSGSSDPDLESLTFAWVQVGGVAVSLSSTTSATPTFTPTALDTYVFELTVFDGIDFSLPDTVSVLVVNGAPPQAVTDFTIQRVGDELRFTWSPVTLDITGLPTTIDRYIIYRGTSAFFTPGPGNQIGFTTPPTVTITDNNIGGANVVGDTLNQYFYVLEAIDAWGNSSALSNRVGEYDYQIITTTSTDYNLICIPFANTGITTADQLIQAIGTGNVLTVNRYVATSQSFQSRFAAGFGTNFSVVPGGIYQVNAAQPTVFTVAGAVPAPGSISYPIVTTATTDFNFIAIPFDRAADFSVAQDVINNIPGVLNTLNNFVASSQSYQSRFAIGFGTNFTVRAGKPYQANAATAGTFPQ